MASKLLSDLDSRFRPLAEQWLALCAQAGIHVTVICTLRSEEEQQAAFLHGFSRLLKGMHLPHPPEGKSLAMDIAPTEYLAMKNWNPQGQLWWKIAGFAKSLGLRSGMDWDDVGLPPVGHPHEGELYDPGHSEFRSK